MARLLVVTLWADTNRPSLGLGLRGTVITIQRMTCGVTGSKVPIGATSAHEILEGAPTLH